MARITIGMQCFWGAEALFGSKFGVISTRVGYAGGSSKNPNYYNMDDHIETVDIEYDSDKITFVELLELFFKSHDPTISFKRQYISAIFYRNEEEKNCIEKFIATKKSDYSKPIVTEIIKMNKFTNAENYHQKYFLRKHKNIMMELDLDDDSKLVTSPLATKLNGLCAGFGTLELIDEANRQKLSEENLNILKKFIKDGPKMVECGF